jgi:hypothetical protein
MESTVTRRETGEERMAQVLYGEGVASHTGPESCAAYREACGEALTREHADQPLRAKVFSSRTPANFGVSDSNREKQTLARIQPNLVRALLG